MNDNQNFLIVTLEILINLRNHVFKHVGLRVKGLGLAATLMSACASQPEELQTSYTSNLRFQDWSCRNLATEAASVERRVSELHGSLKETAGNNQTRMAIGLILFSPALFFLEGGDSAEVAEFTRLKGERDAIDRVARLKGCSEVPHQAKPSGKQANIYQQLKELKKNER